MIKKTLYAVLAVVLYFSVPAAVRALYPDDGKAVYCNNNENSVCQLYQICRQALDKYPESEITEKGKDCILTIESRQLIIRRKMTGDEIGYFYITKRLSAQNTSFEH